MAKKQKVEQLEATEPQNMAEFVSWAMRQLHSALLVGGGKGMESELYMVLPYFARWQERAKASIMKGKAK